MAVDEGKDGRSGSPEGPPYSIGEDVISAGYHATVDDGRNKTAAAIDQITLPPPTPGSRPHGIPVIIPITPDDDFTPPNSPQRL